MNFTVSCPACGSRKREASYRVPDHEYNLGRSTDYALCADCGTMVQTPMPDLEMLSTFYPADYHSFAAGGWLARLKDQARLRRLKSLVAADRAVILDYGCGDGRFIKEAARQASGWVFWGFEIAAQKALDVALDGRVTIIRGSIDHLLDVLPACNLITMNHVLEHLPDPLAVLAALHGRTAEGGIMEGQTPAADSLERRVFRTRWSGFHAPRHTVVFSRLGLQHILTNAGFRDPQVTPAFNPAAMAVSLASLPHGDNPGTIRRHGLTWLICIGAAAALHPLERLSRSPGVVNYTARKITH